MLDNSDFADTDIPFEVPVPEKQHLPVSWEVVQANQLKTMSKITIEDYQQYTAMS